MSIKILLVDDHQIVRDGLRSLIERQADMEVVAEADNGRLAMRQIRELAPDVVIMDVAMPDLNGVDASRQILAEFPQVRIIGLSMYSDRRFIAGMLRAGAAGYLLKDCAFEELNTAIRAVIRKQTYVSPSIANVVVEDYVNHLNETDPVFPPRLSNREREILQLLAEGQNTKQAAIALNVSIKTVEFYRRKVMAKLKVPTMAGLIKYAIREGLIPLDD